MISASLVTINLVVNASFSLIAGVVLVQAAQWLFRIGPGNWRTVLLFLALGKMVTETILGLPSNSVLISGLDPFALPARHQILEIGAGWHYWLGSWLGLPVLSLNFNVEPLAGPALAASVGDYVAIWLRGHLGTLHLEFIVGAVLAISLLRGSRRVVASMLFHRWQRRQRESGQLITRAAQDFRMVEVYRAAQFAGSPFTGGVLAPYICLPRHSVDLDVEEVQAVIAHELGHVAHFDAVKLLVLGLIGDLFWFVPGIFWLRRSIEQSLEVSADRFAVASGVRPETLASALVSAKEFMLDPLPPGTPVSAFCARPRHFFGQRVQMLLGANQRPPRFGWQFAPVRWVLAIMVFALVSGATFAGNQVATATARPLWPSIEWIENLLQSRGP